MKVGAVTAKRIAGGVRVTARVKRNGKAATAVYTVGPGKSKPKPVNATAKQIARGCR